MNQRSEQPPADTPALGYATYASLPRRPCSASRVGLILSLVACGVVVMICFVYPSRYSGGNAKAQIAHACIDTYGPIQVAIQHYHLRTGQHPSRLQDLVTRPEGLSSWRGPYIEDPTKLKDPWGEEYHYLSPGRNGAAYDLWSSGPDKLSGTEDDITSWPKQ